VIITRTPLRISFLGGGTDYPEYYHRHGGETLATSINHYTMVTVNKLTRFVDYRIRVHYSTVESVNCLDEIKHPSARECLRFMGIDEGIEIHYINDLPARTGLGSSSSATVSLLHALHAYKGEMASREQLAEEAVYVEQQCIKERVGSQDQWICAQGGLRHMTFNSNGSVRTDPVVLSPDRQLAFQERLLLLYTGIQRNAHDILDEQMQRTETGVNSENLAQLKVLTSEAAKLLASSCDLGQFGTLLHQSWLLKRKLSSKVSSNYIDDIYDRALHAGAVGGKLLGAGGGGFFLFYVEAQNRDNVVRALPELRETPFAFDELGTQVIVYRP